MSIKRTGQIPASEITPEPVYRSRRRFMQGLIGSGAALYAGAAAAKPSFVADGATARGPEWLRNGVGQATAEARTVDEELTPYKHVTTYNNFYEFGYDKSDPAENSGSLQPYPWQVEVAGHAGKTGTFDLEQMLKGIQMEERVYRLRCVEAWSMVIPWIGFELGTLLKRFEPTSRAKYVKFTTLNDPEQMPAVSNAFSTIDWPYVEGLRMDEAMHPLTILATGLYGKPLPNQNGAPLRLVVPWKYGFKSIKSIVRIEFTEKQPLNSWQQSAPSEYGFYANVNPKVDHPRWSQATERRLPSGLFSPNIIDTRMFNGYADEVAHLYKGMDLRKKF